MWLLHHTRPPARAAGDSSCAVAVLLWLRLQAAACGKDRGRDVPGLPGTDSRSSVRVHDSPALRPSSTTKVWDPNGSTCSVQPQQPTGPPLRSCHGTWRHFIRSRQTYRLLPTPTDCDPAAGINAACNQGKLAKIAKLGVWF